MISPLRSRYSASQLTFPPFDIAAKSACASQQSEEDEEAHLSLGPPPGPGLCDTYSGPSFLDSLTCICASLSSLHGVILCCGCMRCGGMAIHHGIP